jgi:hypothetical protein
MINISDITTQAALTSDIFAEFANKIAKCRDAQLRAHLNKKLNLNLKDNLDLSKFALEHMCRVSIVNGYRYIADNIPVFEITEQRIPIYDGEMWSMKTYTKFL